ncbi:MAG: hypothetical protein V4534_09080 [Myxococcota bacterium]
MIRRLNDALRASFVIDEHKHPTLPATKKPDRSRPLASEQMASSRTQIRKNSLTESSKVYCLMEKYHLPPELITEKMMFDRLLLPIKPKEYQGVIDTLNTATFVRRFDDIRRGLDLHIMALLYLYLYNNPESNRCSKEVSRIFEGYPDLLHAQTEDLLKHDANARTKKP